MSQVLPTATSSTSFKTVFRAALEAYKTHTKKDIASHPLAAQLQSCDSPGAILAVLRAQAQAFDQAHCADERLTKWLDPTVNVLYAFSVTLGNGVGMIFPPSIAVFAGIGILLQAIQDVRATQNTLGEIFGRMEYFFKRLETYIEVRPTAAMMDIIVKIMVEVLLILGIVTKEIGQGTMKKYLKKLVGRKDVEDALQRLDRLTQEEARMAAAESLKLTRSIDDTVQGVDNKVRGVDDRVKGVDHKVGSFIEGGKETRVAIQQVANQVTEISRNELRQDLRKWISFPDPSVNYNTACDAHHEGTALWCVQSNAFARWKASGPLLWIYGKPGSGKSVLSSVIIKDIKSMSDAGLAFLAYFYFDFKDTEKQDTRALLLSLLVQLSNQSDILCDALFFLYSAHKRGSEQPTNDSLLRCFKYMLMTAGQVPIYLIMDALDECPNGSGLPSPREKLLDFVDELVKLRHPTLRLCITSRPEFDIRTALEPIATQQVSLHDESGQTQDIVDYVINVVRSDRKMKRWRDEEKNMVIEKLAEKADGMFRWVYCQLEVLRHCFPANVRRVLEELPKSLDETYERILKQINNANREHSYRLLQCLTVAVRPLRVEELAELLAIDFEAGGIPKLNADWRWEDQEEAVLSACSSLVTVIIENGSRVVQFSHFSVKEFLISDRLASSTEEVSRFHIPIEPSHAILARACLGVLLRLDDRTDKDSVEKIPLFRYAAEYWYRHAQIGNVESQIKDAMDRFFDMDRPHFSAWVRIHDVDKSWWTRRSKWNTVALTPAAALYYAALCGFYGLVGRLLDKHPQHVSAQAGRYGTPLHATLFEEGHIEVAKLLIERGADVNALGVDNWTPLHFASRFGHLDVAKRLLDRRADSNSKIRDGWTSLHLAAANRHIEIAQVLLEVGAEVNARSDEGSTPLHEASRGGEPDIVRLLLSHRADARVRDNGRDSPLHLAASSGSLAVSRILLEHDSEMINSQNNHGSTPLHRASASGYLDLVRLFLDHNADPHVHDNHRNTPLHLAAASGSPEVARELLERNAKVDAQNDNGSTPLHKASENGHPDVVRLLLDHWHAAAHVRDNSSNAPLHLAAANGNLEAARILLERNADVNARNDCGSTPLHRASKNLWRGYPDVVRLLLDHGAVAHVRDHSGSTPSEVATGWRRDEIVELLSKHTTTEK